MRVERDVVLFQVRVQLVCPEDFGDLHQLVVVIVTVEERFLPKDLRDLRDVRLSERPDAEDERERRTMLANMHPKPSNTTSANGRCDSAHANGSRLTPHVQRIVVHLVIDQQFRAFEVSGRDTDVVRRVGVVEFRETPIDQP